MTKLTRPVLLGLAAYLGWLGISFLLFIVAGKYLSPFSESWVASFPVVAALPALLLAGGVASYFAKEDWVPSSALAGVSGILLFWLFAALSGVWWFVVVAVILGVVLALASGYVVQHVLHRG